MSKEVYVSFETAKHLKEKGFNWDCYAVYGRKGEFHRYTDKAFNNGGLHVTSAPTQQMACRWLREEYYIDVLPLVRHVNKFAGELPIKEYSYRIYDSEGNVRVSSRNWFRAYEKSIEEALEYVLTNLI